MMRLGRKGGFVTAVGILISVPLVLAACGGSHSADANSATTSTSARAATTTTLSANETAVLAAYRAGWGAYTGALKTANAFDPSLPATMAQPLLQKIEAQLLGDQHAGEIGTGAVQLHPKVSSITATTATVVDCAYSSSEYVYVKTGKLVPPITKPEHVGVKATMELVGGTWKVAQQSVTEGKCSVGS
jgi:hypothetical protein